MIQLKLLWVMIVRIQLNQRSRFFVRACINAERRTEYNKSSLRKLRVEGRLPAVVYGNKSDSLVIHVSTKDVRKQMQIGRTELIDLKIEGVGTYPVMLGEIQNDGLSSELLHIDFHRIELNTKIKVKIQVSFQGDPVGVKEGGILQTLETHVEVEGLPADMPATIEVDVSGLGIGDKLSASDITLADNLTLTSAPDMLMASVIVPRAMKEEADEPADEVAAEEAKEETVA
jgi:large subunit ribosomal protein L25